MDPKTKPISPHCEQRVRSGCLYAILSLLFFMCGLVMLIHLLTTPLDWKDGEHLIGLAISLFWVIAGGLLTYYQLKDALFPLQSSFAKSVLSQFDFPEEITDIKKLFYEINEDISHNGQWFDRMAIGSTWIFGDGAMKIERVCGLFWEESTHSHNGKVDYTYAIVTVDHNRNCMHTFFRRKDDWKAAWSCLNLRIPAAKTGNENELTDFLHWTQSDWRAFQAAFQAHKKQLSTASSPAKAAAQDMVLTDRIGLNSSRISPESIHKELLALRPGESFRLAPIQPFGSVKALSCTCESMEPKTYRIRCYTVNKQACSEVFSPSQAMQVMTAFYHKKLPEFADWQSN